MHPVTLGKHWNPFSARAPPRTPLGEITTLPQTTESPGRRKPPHPHPTPSMPLAPRTSMPSASPFPHTTLAPSRAFWTRACQQLPIFWTKNAPEGRILHYKYNFIVFSDVCDPRTPTTGGETPITSTSVLLCPKLVSLRFFLAGYTALSIGTDIGVIKWPWRRDIPNLRYFTEFDSSAGRLS